ncbi:MAG TPA: flagellar motor stator protein MotA [Dissulfurispiraceae bacterium]|nr:flagellar motor stator protein MotA [Dissulfurispiraceae bacterium]
MFALIGMAVVILSVVGGFLIEKGNLGVLFQPAEFLIIFGAAGGAFLISSPPKVVRLVTKNIATVIKSKGTTKAQYLELLTLLYHLFAKIRKEGLISVEPDIENPEKSTLFNKFVNGTANREAIHFICDNLKVIISTNVPSHELDSLMDLEIDAHYHEAITPSKMVSKIADALPGLGIVAAVLGVVLTMGKIDQPPAVLGHSIGAALVGTFLGVLMCYGFVGPMATNLEHTAKEKNVYFQVIKLAVVTFVRGAAPQMAVEFGRRAIPSKERPSFSELERTVRGR